MLLAGVIVWQGTSAVLLWRGARAWWSAWTDAASAARAGLILLGALWFALAIATEVFIAYERGVSESLYWTLAIATLATIVLLQVVGTPPDHRPAGG